MLAPAGLTGSYENNCSISQGPEPSHTWTGNTCCKQIEGQYPLILWFCAPNLSKMQRKTNKSAKCLKKHAFFPLSHQCKFTCCEKMLRARYTDLRADTVKSASQIFWFPITFPYKKLTKKHWWILHLGGKRASFRASLRHGLNNPLVWLISSANFQNEKFCFTQPKFWKMFLPSKKWFQKEFFTHITMVILGSFLKHNNICATKRHSPPRLVPGTSGWRTGLKTCRAYEKSISHCTHFLEGQILNHPSWLEICNHLFYDAVLSVHHPTSEFGNSSSKPTSLRSFIALICLDLLKQCNSKSVPTTRKNAPGPRVNAAWFFWPDHISRWSTTLENSQKSSLNHL